MRATNRIQNVHFIYIKKKNVCFFLCCVPSCLFSTAYLHNHLSFSFSPFFISHRHFLPPFHAGERVLASGSVQLPRFTLLESGSLLISPSHLSDAGTYTCMASNSRGIDEASADLLVWGKQDRNWMHFAHHSYSLYNLQSQLPSFYTLSSTYV